MFLCRFCSERSDNYIRHITHQSFHTAAALRTQFWCGYNGCKKVFRKQLHLKLHVDRVHTLKYVNTARKALPLTPSGTFQCNLDICKEEFSKKSTFFKHLQDHMDDGYAIRCPYSECNKQFSKKSTWLSHLQRKHSGKTLEMASSLGQSQNIELCTPLSNVEKYVEMYNTNLTNFYLKLEAN